MAHSSQQKELTLEEYASRIADFEELGSREKIDYLVFFLNKYKENNGVRKSDVDTLCKTLKIKTYSRTSQYFSEEASKKRGGKYIRTKNGYVLERSFFRRLDRIITGNPRRIQVDDGLRDLVGRVADTQEQDFLQETINCLSVQANRAALVMMWILTMDHLQKYIFNDQNRLTDFNSTLSKRKLKITQVKDYDDFSVLKEGDVIEIAKSAKIISGDVRKILDEKLGTRNSAGHPSSVTVHESKVNEFIFDLTNNVILKH